MLLCLHEESAVAIGHGYAKVTGKAMAVAVIPMSGCSTPPWRCSTPGATACRSSFSAPPDRSTRPSAVLGSTGFIPRATKARSFAIIPSGTISRLADRRTRSDPARGLDRQHRSERAVYINLDAEMQEAKLPEPLPPIDTQRFMPPVPSAAPADQMRQAAELLRGAKHPVLLIGRVSRSLDAWNSRVALAEHLNARVITDLKTGAAFPTDHPLHAGPRARSCRTPRHSTRCAPPT